MIKKAIKPRQRTIHEMFQFLKNLKRQIGYYRYKNISFSQEGEDLILNRLFEDKKSGFYVDVGAHHPIRFSNTYFFYKKGWSGINIDAMPGSMKPFRILRHRDINIESPISDHGEEIKYYIFDEPALNGFSEKLSRDRNFETQFKIIDTKILKTVRLDTILAMNLTKDTKIDFLSVDVEGLDLSVLKSNDWIKFRPKFVIVEILSNNFENIAKDPVFVFLKIHKYKLISKTLNSCIFSDDGN